MLFSSRSNFPIGLDISDQSLKIVQLKKYGEKIKIQALGKKTLPKGLFVNGEVKKRDEIIKAIKELIDNPSFGSISGKEVIACLPESKTFIKLIEVEKTSADMAAIIDSEIEKHVPISLEEIYYDWQVIKNHSDKQMILIGAAPRNIINQYTDLLDQAKLSIIALEIEPISICRCLLAEEHYKYKGNKDQNYGLVDIGANRSNFTVYSGGTILFSFSMPISGNKITEMISKNLLIDYAQAEKAKIICGLDDKKAQGIIKDMLYGMIKDLVGKIKESIMYYDTHFNDRGPLNKIILCGGGSNIKNLDSLINEYINIPIEHGDPFINLNEAKEKTSGLFMETHSLNSNFAPKIKNKTSKVTQDSSITYATAIGLALRGIFIDNI